MIVKFKNFKSKFHLFITIVCFFLLSVSTFNKTYIPITSGVSENGVIESCPEHIKHNKIIELIKDVIGKSDKSDTFEKICFCYHTNLRRNLNYALADLISLNFLQHSKYFKYSYKFNIPEDIKRSFNNKSPPLLIF